MNIFKNFSDVSVKYLNRRSKKAKEKEREQLLYEEATILDSMKTIFYAFLLAIAFRSLLYEPFHIPSASMYPNLIEGDYVLVSKFSYGYSKYSFPFGIFPIKERIFQKHKPQRGDVIVFRYPKNIRVNYIKRLIGLPGDEVQMIDGILYLNGESVKTKYNNTYDLYKPLFVGDEVFISADEYTETLNSGKEYKIIDTIESAVDNTEVFKVPDGMYFFLGDNRDNSQDSRFEEYTGFVPEQNVVGKAKIIILSTSEPIWHFWHWHKIFRFDRALLGIN